MRCHSVGCGTASQTRSATQSITPSFAADHIALWFALMMMLATWSRRTTHAGAIAENR